jgi:uncharacterized membrane protein YuzA (DUF378 family)
LLFKCFYAVLYLFWVIFRRPVLTASIVIVFLLKTPWVGFQTTSLVLLVFGSGSSFICIVRVIYIIKSGVCLSVCLSTLPTSPPVLNLLDSQGYLWLSYDLGEVIKLIEETFKPTFFFQKNTLCYSFRIIVIPSILVSFLPNYCNFKYLSSFTLPTPTRTHFISGLNS